MADVPSHRVLAMLRGEREALLSIHIAPRVVQSDGILEGIFVTGETEASQQVRLAVRDSYQRLLEASMETEVRKEARVRAEDAAIKVFAENLRELLLAPALGQKQLLALDPGFRTGCKLVCLDRQGRLLHHDTVYPLLGGRGEQEAAKKVDQLCGQYHVEAIAVGNGTGGQTEAFLRRLELGPRIAVVMVNESGASVTQPRRWRGLSFPMRHYRPGGCIHRSPPHGPTGRIGQDRPQVHRCGPVPHDVDQKALKERLDDAVGSCVNNVGVELNTASGEFSLTFLAGPRLAKAIVEYRNSYGPFTSRESLKKVPRLGPKAFEQAAGFLRIREGTHPLDASAVHPELRGGGGHRQRPGPSAGPSGGRRQYIRADRSPAISERHDGTAHVD